MGYGPVLVGLKENPTDLYSDNCLHGDPCEEEDNGCAGDEDGC